MSVTKLCDLYGEIYAQWLCANRKINILNYIKSNLDGVELGKIYVFEKSVSEDGRVSRHKKNRRTILKGKCFYIDRYKIGFEILKGEKVLYKEFFPNHIGCLAIKKVVSKHD